MNCQLVMTVLGPDRPGIVEAIAEQIQNCQGSWQASRLAHLQDQFAGIIELTLPVDQQEAFQNSLKELDQQMNLQCLLSVVKTTGSSAKSVTLEFIGQDRPGIVFAITDLLHDLNVNVEEMDTAVQAAPMSGENLFSAAFKVQLPDQLDMDLLEQRLAGIGEELMLDLRIED